MSSLFVMLRDVFAVFACQLRGYDDFANSNLSRNSCRHDLRSYSIMHGMLVF